MHTSTFVWHKVPGIETKVRSSFLLYRNVVVIYNNSTKIAEVCIRKGFDCIISWQRFFIFQETSKLDYQC